MIERYLVKSGKERPLRLNPSGLELLAGLVVRIIFRKEGILIEIVTLFVVLDIIGYFY